MASNDIIDSIICYQIDSEKWYKFRAKVFVDATGDGIVGFKAGAEYRIGRESKYEFNEKLAPKVADRATMGSSIMFNAFELNYEVDFEPPHWAERFSEKDLRFRDHSDFSAGYWWIEVGYPYDTIHDNEKIRDELLRQLLGVWAHIKREHKAKKYAIYWIGMIPGKRESRRLIGDYILNEKDIKKGKEFWDRVAYGGWFIDIHTIGGILAKNEPPEPSIADLRYKEYAYVRPYSIPFRCLYSKNIRNLLMAGRNISVSHVALGSTRVQGTCAVIGQAVGTAAYLCVKYNCLPREVCKKYIKELQQLLLKQDCYIINVRNEDPNDLARRAKVRASSSASLEFPEGNDLHELNIARGQLFPYSGDFLERISLRIISKRSDKVSLKLHLRSAKSVWDFSSEEDLAICEVEIPSKFDGWVDFDINLKVSPKKLYWIWLEPLRKVYWYHSSYEPTGTVAVCKPPYFEKTWVWVRGCYSLKLYPPSKPYEPENVINGVARPDTWPNLWISDPNLPLPQWLELDFGEEVTFNTIYLTFDTNLNFRYGYPPLYRARECVKDYIIYYLDENDFWRPIVKVWDNYHRHRIHKFERVKSNKIRIEVLSTNGDASARIYEVRVYDE